MQAAGGKAEDQVTGPNSLAIEHFRLLHHSNDCAADIVFTFFVKSRHLGGLTTDQGAAILSAGPGETLNDFRKNARLKFAGAEVIEEEQRLGAKHCDIIYAMI